MNIEHERFDDLLVISILEEKLDAQTGAGLKKIVSSLISEDISGIVINLGAVDFIDSSGLNELVICAKRFGGILPITLTGTQPNVMDMFRLTRMNRMFQLFESNSDAVSYLSRHNLSPA